MPHVKINYPRPFVPTATLDGSDPKSFARGKDQLVVSWNEIGWVQVSVYPEGWDNTGDAEHVQVNPQELDLLIRTLQKARRKAYGKGNRWYGYEDADRLILDARPLFEGQPDL